MSVQHKIYAAYENVKKYVLKECSINIIHNIILKETNIRWYLRIFT